MKKFLATALIMGLTMVFSGCGGSAPPTEPASDSVTDSGGPDASMDESTESTEESDGEETATE